MKNSNGCLNLTTMLCMVVFCSTLRAGASFEVPNKVIEKINSFEIKNEEVREHLHLFARLYLQYLNSDEISANNGAILEIVTSRYALRLLSLRQCLLKKFDGEPSDEYMDQITSTILNLEPDYYTKEIRADARIQPIIFQLADASLSPYCILNIE